MSILQSTFDKHKKLMLEYFLIEADLTPEQNQAIKYVYVMFRDLLSDVIKEAKQNGVTPENCSKTFQSFFRESYSVPPKLPKDGGQNMKIRKDDSLSKLYVTFPEKIRKILPSLAKEIEVRLQVLQGGSNAEFNSNNGIMNQLVTRVPNMLKNFDEYKISLQHEMQHIIDKGGSEDETIENNFVRGLVYSLIPGEIKAHAKQYAYMYYKKFPNDNQLDFEKFKKEFFEKGNAKLDNYIKYGDRPEKIKTVYNLNDDLYQKMINGFKDFKTALIRSFLYFKQK